MRARLVNTGLQYANGIRIKTVTQFFLDTTFHFHDACELVLIEQGHGKRVVGDHTGAFEHGDLVVMGPGLPHVWQHDGTYYQKKTDGVKAIVIYFAPAFLLGMLNDTQTISLINSLLLNAARGLEITGATKMTIRSLLTGIDTFPELKKMAAFLEVMELLATTSDYQHLASEGYRNAYTKKDNVRFNEVHQYMLANFHREITLEEISTVARMAPTAFCRYFKLHTKRSFIQFLNELRISRACRLLENSHCSTADIAYKCGFNNLTYFNKCFKQIQHVTPSEYRKQMTSGKIAV